MNVSVNVLLVTAVDVLRAEGLSRRTTRCLDDVMKGGACRCPGGDPETAVSPRIRLFHAHVSLLVSVGVSVVREQITVPREVTRVRCPKCSPSFLLLSASKPDGGAWSRRRSRLPTAVSALQATRLVLPLALTQLLPLRVFWADGGTVLTI